jgi:hypothetical protein
MRKNLPSVIGWRAGGMMTQKQFAADEPRLAAAAFAFSFLFPCYS